jgi:hypothetical protein
MRYQSSLRSLRSLKLGLADAAAILGDVMHLPSPLNLPGCAKPYPGLWSVGFELCRWERRRPAGSLAAIVPG